MGIGPVGRPLEIPESKHIGFIISIEEAKMLKVIAQREGKSISQIAREVLSEYVKAHAAGNTQFLLEKWYEDPTFHALPTLGEVQPADYLDGLTQAEVNELDDKSLQRRLEIEAAQERRGRRSSYSLKPNSFSDVSISGNRRTAKK